MELSGGKLSSMAHIKHANTATKDASEPDQEAAELNTPSGYSLLSAGSVPGRCDRVDPR